MKIIAYIRVSTDEQDKSGLGLEAQETRIRNYCQLYDLHLVGVFKDAASGKNCKRPGLQTALDRLGRDGIEGLIVAKLDRLTRSVKDLGFLLESYFVKFSLVSVNEQVDTRTAAGRLVMNMLTSVAQWEREVISERTVDALKVKKGRQEKTGGLVPFGFDQIEGRLVENSHEQFVISLIKNFRNDGLRANTIARKLNLQGYVTKTGRPWHNVQIERILSQAV